MGNNHPIGDRYFSQQTDGKLLIKYCVKKIRISEVILEIFFKFFKEMTKPLKKASQTINQNRSTAQSLALSIIICCFLTSMTPLVCKHNNIILII